MNPIVQFFIGSVIRKALTSLSVVILVSGLGLGTWYYQYKSDYYKDKYNVEEQKNANLSKSLDDCIKTSKISQETYKRNEIISKKSDKQKRRIGSLYTEKETKADTEIKRTIKEGVILNDEAIDIFNDLFKSFNRGL